MKFYVKESASKQTITAYMDAVNSIKDIANADQESFWVIGLDIKNKEVLKECVFLGGLSSCIADPRIIFKRLLMAGCASFICVHNHPSGSSDPSDEDKAVARRLLEGASILNLTMLDNIIIGENIFSFARAGMLK
jgi:DNA repair protein RadC